MTSATATDLVAAGSLTAGDTFEMIFVNTSTTLADSLIVAVGTGVTHGGTATSLTVAAGQTGVFTFVVTSSTAIVFYRTATAGVAVAAA
jgi:hypothetical protein